MHHFKKIHGFFQLHVFLATKPTVISVVITWMNAALIWMTVTVTLNVFLMVTAAQMYPLYNTNAMVKTYIIILVLNNTTFVK